MVSRARLASDDCEELIGALNDELCVIKAQLSNLTRSLSVPVEVPPPPPYRPSPSVDPIIYRPPRSRKDAIGWSICVSTEQPPTPLPRITSRHKKKAEKAGTSDEVAPAPDTTLQLLRVVDKREEERAKARSRYLSLMRIHIEQQLREFVEREALRRKRKERKERRAKEARKQLKPTRFRSSGMDDKGYLENLYQSCLYKIIGVEQGMKKCGKLKTLPELKDFWEQMLSPLQSTGCKYQEDELPVWPEEEEGEGEQEETNSWAITASKNQTGEALSPVQVPAPSPTPTPLRFIPCKLPELKPISEILDEDEERTLLLKPVSQYQGPVTTQRVLMHKVYQRAKANEIAMRSLLPHGLNIERPSFRVCEASVLPACRAPKRQSPAVLPPLSHVPECPLRTDVTMPDSQTTLKHSIKNQDLELKCLRESNSSSRYSGRVKCLLHPLAVTVTASKESLLSSSHALSPSKPVCVPLTMSDLLQNSVTKEVSEKTSSWTNYQVAGLGK